jgi:hypothetical protein
MVDTRLLSFVGALIVFAYTVPYVRGEGLSKETSKENPPIEQLLSRVPDGATWQDLPADLRADFQERASSLLVRDREAWGLSGLQQKEDLLLSAPTPAMTENIDRVLSVTFASELPGGFKLARDVENADLRRLLIRIYLTITDDRGYMLYNHPDFKGWDGMPVKELQLLDHEHVKAMAVWLRQTEDSLRNIPDSRLNPLERALRAKSYFTTRAGKYFDKPAVAMNGSLGYSGLYKRPMEERPFSSDEALLDAYNASMFTEFREVNLGTLDAFMFDYGDEFDKTALKDKGMSDELANNILKLGNLYRTRTQAPAREEQTLHDLLSFQEGRNLGFVHGISNFKC